MGAATNTWNFSAIPGHSILKFDLRNTMVVAVMVGHSQSPFHALTAQTRQM